MAQTQSITTEEKREPEVAPRRSIVLDVIGGMAAGTLALSAMWSSIRTYAHKSLRQTGLLKGAYEARNLDFASVTHGTPNPLNRTQEIASQYKDAVGKAYEAIGITNSVQKFKHLLSKDEKVKVVMLGGTVIGVVMGAMIKLREDRRLALQLERLERKLDAQDKEKSASLS